MPNLFTRLMRLLPLASLLALPFSASSQQPAPSAQKWRQVQKNDPARDIPYTQFTLAGKFVKWPKGDASTRPTLQFDCAPGETTRGSKGEFIQATLLAGVPLKIDFIEPDEIKQAISFFPLVKVEYRLDQGKARREKWTPGADKTSAAIPEETAKRVLEVHSFVITANENKAGEITMQFDLPDASEVVAACDLREHKK